MMRIVDDLLNIDDDTRTGAKLKGVKKIVLHWTGNVNIGAKGNRDYWEQLGGKPSGVSASAHFVIDQDGTIIRCIPTDEKAFHVGSSAVDPVSGKLYTDYARKVFGDYATATASPNNWTIGVELCPRLATEDDANGAGEFTDETLEAGAELVAGLLNQFNLTVDDITTHYAIVGWKPCPLLWTKHPEKFDEFKQLVRKYL
jgi:N-acetylmuramoyl-L-alanine amidase